MAGQNGKADDQFPYEFKIVKVDDMSIDQEYQRPLTSFVNRVTDNWDPALVGTLVTSDRGKGKVAVIDGQTRMSAAKRLKIPALPVLVYYKLTQADEARLFAKLQKERRGIASYHRFRAALVAGEPEAVEIQEIVEESGYEVGSAGTSTKAISAVAALEKVFRDSPTTLERALVIFKSAWGERHVPPGDLLKGLGYFLKKNPETDDERLARRIGAQSPDGIKRRAMALQEGGGGGSRDKYFAGAIEGVYKSRS